MRGKVVSYDSQKGIGKILIKKEGIKLFNIDEWIDYDKLPQTGLEVEFEIENNELKNILSLHSEGNLFDKLNEKIIYSLPIGLNIQENVSLDYCLEEFFRKFKKIALKYRDIANSTKTLPYKKIKRFLFTAYNNLLELDSQINDTRLREVKNSLDEIEYHYDKLKNETKNPLYIILEKLVLSKQKNYQILKKRFEDNKILITENTKTTNLLELKIEKLKNELLEYNPKSQEYAEKLSILKLYKRKYVDLIDETQNLKEDNSKIVDDISQFENVYKSIFEKFFNKEVSIILRILTKEMNALSYQFDTILWENAKISKPIQKFFEKAKIEGSYSTKTFMKYYLKNLNTEKMNTKDVELVEIFNELKVFSKNIIIYDRNKNTAREISLYIENLDHDNNVKIFDSIKEFVSYIKENSSNIDIIIAENDEYSSNLISKLSIVLEKIGIDLLLFNDIPKLYKELKKVI